MTPDAAGRLYTQLEFRSANDPTKVGQAARDVIVLHGPQPGGMSHGPNRAVCTGEGVPVAYPCPTAVTIAHALGVDVPAEVSDVR